MAILGLPTVQLFGISSTEKSHIRSAKNNIPFHDRRLFPSTIKVASTLSLSCFASLSHFALLRVDAAWPRLGRAFRTAPVSRQTNPNPVWHSPRFHSRPATLLRTPFCPFHRSALFLPAGALVKKETSRNRQKGKKHEIRRSQHTNQRGCRFPRRSTGVRSQ